MWAAAGVVAGSRTSGGGGVDLPTLLVTAVASAAAAYVTSQVWAPGTLASAAFTPVVVAVLKELLSRPAEVVVTRAVPVRGVVRSTTPGDEPPAAAVPSALPAERVPQHGEILGSSVAPRRRSWWPAILTGLLGFLVAAVIITVPELVAGSSAAGGGRDTTFFGGHGRAGDRAPATTTTTPTETETTAPADTVTIPPPAATVTVPPAETTPVPPAETTTVPPTETTPAAPGTVVPVPPQPSR